MTSTLKIDPPQWGAHTLYYFSSFMKPKKTFLIFKLETCTINQNYRTKLKLIDYESSKIAQQKKPVTLFNQDILGKSVGLYYKHITIVNDNSKLRRNLEHHSRVINYAPSGIIETLIIIVTMFTVQTTNCGVCHSSHHLQS
jgi:hypothetical protein